MSGSHITRNPLIAQLIPRSHDCTPPRCRLHARDQRLESIRCDAQSRLARRPPSYPSAAQNPADAIAAITTRHHAIDPFTSRAATHRPSSLCGVGSNRAHESRTVGDAAPPGRGCGCLHVGRLQVSPPLSPIALRPLLLSSLHCCLTNCCLNLTRYSGSVASGARTVGYTLSEGACGRAGTQVVSCCQTYRPAHRDRPRKCSGWPCR